MRKIYLLCTAILAGVSLSFAQGVTTSTLNGKITAQSKNVTTDTKPSDADPIPGANVVATHEPSGTIFGTVSLPDGKFTIPNMRVGGPYKVEVSFVGYQTQTFVEIYLKLAEPFSLNISLKEESTTLAEVIVSGIEDKLMNGTLTGSVTNIGTRQLMGLPTISRSINDMTRMTPQATSTSTGSIGGRNYRQNYITVDGSDFNNTFGIGSNLPANGSPISLDALEEISVNVTPYDIRQSGFIGSSINAVTRAGTNNFSGSAYTFFRDENQQGNKVKDNTPLVRQDLQVNTSGLRIGGPIIKNKLFFFLNYETGKTTRPGQTNVAATTAAPFGSAPNISRPLNTELDAISNFLRTTYNYETGPYEGYENVSDNTRLVGRLDWNINSNHRFNVRYSQVESKDPSFMSGSRTPFTNYVGTSSSRTTNNALWYKNSNYYQEANFYSWAAELNSTFGKFANTLRATYTHQNDPRSSESSTFPFVDILDGTGGNPGVPFTSFGYEPLPTETSGM